MVELSGTAREWVVSTLTGPEEPVRLSVHEGNGPLRWRLDREVAGRGGFFPREVGANFSRESKSLGVRARFAAPRPAGRTGFVSLLDGPLEPDRQPLRGRGGARRVDGHGTFHPSCGGSGAGGRGAARTSKPYSQDRATRRFLPPQIWSSSSRALLFWPGGRRTAEMICSTRTMPSPFCSLSAAGSITWYATCHATWPRP